MAEIVIARVAVVDDELVAAWAHLMPQLSVHAAAPSREQLAGIAGSQLVARLDGQIVGALCLTVYRTPTGVQARVDDVVVDEATRGRGAGEALMHAAIELARAAGAKVVALTSHPRREAANRLYQRLGFVRRETNVYALALG
jgi:ribosomal protein S18 acetylase RimI-like enzyme|nr:GNAT family N-acetyltransferase [Kofleriaceae bacterium]